MSKKESKTTAPKAFRFAITESANSFTSAVDAVKTVVTRLSNMGNSLDENLKDLTLEQLRAVYLGKGEAEGCSAVFKAIFESEDYAVKRFASQIRDFSERCGLRLKGTVPSALVLPEGVPQDPTEDGWKVFEAWIAENVPFNLKAVETPEEKAERLAKDAEEKGKDWKGAKGRESAILELLKLQKRIKPLNEKQAKLIRLIACNYDAIERTLKEMSADKTLNRVIPEGIKFKE